MTKVVRHLTATIAATTGVGVLLIAPDVYAQAQNFVPLTAIPGVTSGNPTLTSYINALFKLLIGLAALIAVIRLMIAGVKYMGNDSYSSKSDAKGDIKEVVLGLLIILGTVIILQTINPQILNLNVLGPGGTTFQGSSAPPSSGSQNNQPWNTGSGVPTCPDGTPISIGGSCNGQVYVP